MAGPGPKRDYPAAAAAGGGDGGDLILQLLEVRDSRLQAAIFFLSVGCSIVYSAIVNPSVNPEHLFAGFVLLTIGVALALLTLGGAGPRRAAARLEQSLRRFF